MTLLLHALFVSLAIGGLLHLGQHVHNMGAGREGPLPLTAALGGILLALVGAPAAAITYWQLTTQWGALLGTVGDAFSEPPSSAGLRLFVGLAHFAVVFIAVRTYVKPRVA